MYRHRQLLPLFFIALCAHVTSFAQGTLLVANMKEKTLSFVSVSKGKEISKITVNNTPHEVAVSPSGQLATVALYGNKENVGNSIALIDVLKRVHIKDISLGDYKRPHGMEFISEEEVIVTCEANKVLIKVNVQTGAIAEVAKTDQLTSHMVAYAPADRRAYVANISSGTVSVIDVAGNKLVRQVEFAKGIEGIAVSPDGKEVWVPNRTDSTVIAMNTTTFEKSNAMPAHQVAYRIKFTTDGKYAVVSNGLSGNLSIYDVKAKKLIKDVNVIDPGFKPVDEEGNYPVPGGITTSTDGKWVFVACGGYNQAVVVSTSDWTLKQRIAVGAGPDGIYYSPVIQE